MIINLYRNKKNIRVDLSSFSENYEGTCLTFTSSSYIDVYYGYKDNGVFVLHNIEGPAMITTRNSEVWYEFYRNGHCVRMGENCDDEIGEVVQMLKYSDLKYFTNGDLTRTYYV